MRPPAPTPNTALDPRLWQQPPVEFRPVPFWVWNDKQEPEELRRQVRLLAEHGFGGFFIHARVGLQVSYLGAEWFAHVKLCTEEAARLGIHAWIYDEERWPSGYAGGRIAEAGLDYAGYALACLEKDGQRSFEVIRSPASAWLNGASDPDLLDPEVTAAFLRLTHDAYEKAIGDHFGKTTPGTFADEPSYVMWGRSDRFQFVPWTKNIEAIFERSRGYALRPHLASLFYEEGDYRKVRLDFYRTVTERFVESFAKPIYEWSEKHGIASIGHMMMEDSLLSQVQAVGATMPHYEYFHMPGIDYLGDGLYGPLLQKQCASVVRQLGRERMLCESFGGAGWQTSLGRLKPAADLLFALGANLINQHMALYSVRGNRKADYPPSCFYQLPGFTLYKSFNDYLARMSYALTRGEAVRRIVVLHPIQSAWALYSPKNTKPVEQLDARFAELSKRLLEIQRDYDYADELLLEKYGRVEGGRFVVGRAAYDAVVIPSAETWSARTVQLVRAFAEQGGRVIVIEPSARFVDGRPDDALATFLGSKAVRRLAAPTAAALDKALSGVARDVRVTDEAGKLVKTMVYMRRSCGDRDLYFLAFSQQPKAFRARIELEGEGRVELWDGETGAVQGVPSTADAGRTSFEMEIPARGARLIALDRSQPALPTPPVSAVVNESPLPGPWSVTRLDPNVFVLDRAELQLGRSPWSAPMGIAGRATSTVPNVSDALASSIEKGFQPPGTEARLRFRFSIQGDGIEVAAAWLVVDDARAMTEFVVNGKTLGDSGQEWWLDRSFQKLDLRGLLRAGANQILCRVHWSKPFESGSLRATPEGREPDHCYLIGDFTVTWNGGSRVGLVAGRPLPSDPAADLSRAGLPFYAGRVRYETTLPLSAFDASRRYLLRFPQPNGEGLRLSVNGRFVKDLWGSPFEADCTGFLQAGENRIEADLYSTLGNTLGNYHHKAPWTDSGHAFAKYLLAPLGLGGSPTLRVE